MQQIDLRYVTSKTEFILEVQKAAGDFNFARSPFASLSLSEPQAHPQKGPFCIAASQNTLYASLHILAQGKDASYCLAHTEVERKTAAKQAGLTAERPSRRCPLMLQLCWLHVLHTCRSVSSCSCTCHVLLPDTRLSKKFLHGQSKVEVSLAGPENTERCLVV